MIIYISMVVWILFIGAISKERLELIPETNKYEYRSSYVTMFLTMFYIIFFIGLRSAGADTAAYISSFDSVKVGWEYVIQASKENFLFTSGIGFNILERLTKTTFGDNYHIWLFLLALVSGMSVAKTLRKNTKYYIDAMLLFMLMGYYGWMINGIRQFVAVSLSFAAIDKLVNRKLKSYILTILLLSTIHTSVLVMIPIYFVATGEAWNKKTLLLILAGILAVIFTSFTEGAWGEVFTASGYDSELYKFDDGSSFIRTLIFMVPPLLSYVFWDSISSKVTPLINVCINMSIVSVVLSMIANVTSGVLVGRMPIYFSIYNLILLPWLIYNIPNKSTRKMIYIGMYVLYFVLWTMEGIGYYYSDLLFNGAIIY